MTADAGLQVEIQDIIKIGYLNGLFVLARSIGLIGHALDQKRLQQPLYRHPWDEVMLHILLTFLLRCSAACLCGVFVEDLVHGAGIVHEVGRMEGLIT